MTKRTQALIALILFAISLSGCSKRPIVVLSNLSGREVSLITKNEIFLKNGESSQFYWQEFKVGIDGFIYKYKFKKYPPEDFIDQNNDSTILRLEIGADKEIKIIAYDSHINKVQPEGFPLKPIRVRQP